MLIPPEFPLVNQTMDKGKLREVVSECYRELGPAKTAQLADERNGSLVYPFGIRLNHRNRPVQVWFLRYQSRVVDVAVGERL